MSGRPGQASPHWLVGLTRSWGRLLHALALFLLGLGLVVVVVAAALAWRLAQGPLPADWLLPRLEQALSAPSLTVRIGGASLAWEGFTEGAEQPLIIRLDAVRLLGAEDQPLALLPRVQVSLAVGPLLLGRIEPQGVTLQGPRLRVERDPEGQFRLFFSRTDGAAVAAAVPSLAAAFAALAAPPGAAPMPAALRRLRVLRIDDGHLRVDDLALQLHWQADGVTATLNRAAGGGATASASLSLASGAVRLPVALRASLAAGAATAELSGRLGPLVPARLAPLTPSLAPLRLLDAPLTLTASGRIGAALQPEALQAKVEVGAGQVAFGGGVVPLLGATLEASGTPAAMALRLTKLQVAPAPGGSPTTFAATAAVRRADGSFTAQISGSFDRFAFADLPGLWPPDFGPHGLRPWLTENMTAGTAADGHIALTLTAKDDLSDAEVTELGGGFAGHDLTVHWLRPIPPLEHGEAKLTFLSPQALDITITAARQAGGKAGGIVVRSGDVRITGLDVYDQFLTLNGDLSGPVVDLVAVLNHPRLRLVSRSPLNIEHPSGQVSGHLTITDLPLKHDVTMSDVVIAAKGTLSDLHLGAVAFGRDLDQGHLTFTVDNQGLQVAGTAKLAGIESRLTLGLDFRHGGPTQVIEQVQATAEATGAQLAAAGLDTGGALAGPLQLQASEQVQRDGGKNVTVQADLRQATLAVPRLHFRKPAGAAARAELRLTLLHDEVTAMPALRLDGPGLHVAAAVDFVRGKAARVRLAQVVLGPDNDFHGTLEVPRQSGAPWVLHLSGRSLDAESEFGRSETPATGRKPPPETGGPPWLAELAFGRVVLAGPGRQLNDVHGTAAGEGSRVTSATLEGYTGATGGEGGVSVHIASAGAGRTVSVTAADGGALLRALDLTDAVQGGRLAISGRYEDRQPGRPLVGQADMTDFRVRNAPVLAKLLQAMTLYGVVDLLQGPGLGFSHLIAPFRKEDDVLDLSNARAFSSSLGMTARGRIDLTRKRIDIDGTIVPAYFFNTVLGKIPLVGRLFSPEKGGGVLAASYALRGPLDDPQVTVNPLSVLTPGFLRGIFGIFDTLPAPETAPAPAEGAGAPAEGGGR